MRIAAVALIIFLGGCATQSSQPDALYQALGQRQGIERLVTRLLHNIAADERIVELFRDSKIDRLRDKLVEQICALGGGPCVYTGDSMQQSHAGMHLTDAHFNALVEDLIDAMESQRIPVAAQNRLLALLAPMHSDIVYH